MTDQIVSREAMQRRGMAAFVRGASRDDHGMNAGAPGILDWQKGHDAAKAAYTRATMAQAEAVKVSPP